MVEKLAEKKKDIDWITDPKFHIYILTICLNFFQLRGKSGHPLMFRFSQESLRFQKSSCNLGRAVTFPINFKIKALHGGIVKKSFQKC